MSETDTFNDDEEEEMEMETDVLTKYVVTKNRSMNDDEDVISMSHCSSSSLVKSRNNEFNDDVAEMEMENDEDLTKNVVTKSAMVKSRNDDEDVRGMSDWSSLAYDGLSLIM